VSDLAAIAASAREIVQRYGARLSDLNDSDLHDLMLVFRAFAQDLQDEEGRRRERSS
jgi:hypothetical protein